MSFISYAQNFEDVMLWRALKHVQNGFYIDIGAQDPVIDSVSMAFYEHGWRGVHVEPSVLYAKKILRARPDETLIQAAIGSKGGVFRFYEIAGTGLSTGDPQLAEKHRAAGFSVREIDVPCLTLANILDRYSNREIHWLKIDVEGMERQVLQGWPSSTVRPWVVVIESTMPLTQEETHDKWEPLLLGLGYEFAYFDGLNRFYLSKAHLELKDTFRSSPNVFDGFVLSGTSSAPFCSQLIQRLNGTQEETQHLSQTMAERERVLGETQVQLQHAREEWDHRAQAFAQREQELTAQLAHKSEALSVSEAALAQQQAHAQWLQNEWDAAKQRVEEFSQRTSRLEGELDFERQRTVQLKAEPEAAREHESQQQAHAQWLQNEWEAAKAKIDELNHTSHHWWTVADWLNHRLRDVYNTKSWRITWPLRKLDQLTTGLRRPSLHIYTWVVAALKPIVTRLILALMRFALQRPILQAMGLRLLARRPVFKTRLRLLALTKGLRANLPISAPAIGRMESGVELAQLTSSARRVYLDLKRAIELHNQESG